VDQLVATELGSSAENDTNVDEFFASPQRVSNENAVPQATPNDGKNLEKKLQMTEKSRKQSASCGSKPSDSFQYGYMGLVDLSNRATPSPENSTYCSFQNER